MGAFSYGAVAAPWWPYAFILLAGWLPTDMWRWIVLFPPVDSTNGPPFIALARAIATSLVAAVIARLVLYPSGSLADIPALVRIGALVAGFATYLLSGKRVVLGILVAEALLVGIPFAMS